MALNRALVVAASIAGLLVSACTSGQTNTADTKPAPSATQSSTPAPSGPSQTAADAKRDGVIPALARLPFAVRVDASTSVVTPEGVWVLSKPTATAKKYAKGCRLGPATGKYPTTTICTTEYGEVLLLDASRTHILRAYPLPAVPPTFLRVTPSAVYFGRQGDVQLSETALPDSMVGRIDRATLTEKVRVFYGADSEVYQPCFYPPKTWTLTKGSLRMTDLAVDARGVWARDQHGTWTRLDPMTLQIVRRGVTR